MGLFERAAEFNHLAATINRIHFLNNYIKEYLQNGHTYQEYRNEIFLMAYCLKVGVRERIEKFQWPYDMKIIVPLIDKHSMPLNLAILKITDDFFNHVNKSGLTVEVDSILNKGDGFYEIEEAFPPDYRLGLITNHP